MSRTLPTTDRPVNRHLILIPPEEVRRRLGGISRSQEYKLLRNDPDFPRPVVRAGLRRAYSEVEVETYLEKRLHERGVQLELPFDTAK